MTLEFVNLHGERISVDSKGSSKKKRAAKTAESYHKGFRVLGISPAQVAEAIGKHDGSRESFDFAQFDRSAKLQPVRSRPYEVRDAAVQCAVLAAKSGWRCLEIREVKKGNVE